MHSIRKVNIRFVTALACLLGLVMIWPAAAFGAKSRKFVVVIDAGHGGKDYGATENGVNEKDVNLAVALKLGELIKKNLKDTEVIYTRDDDTFVSLQGRANVANKAKADFFISIHCNSVDRNNKNRSTVQGATTYILGQSKEDQHLDVVKRENEVVEKDASDKAHFAHFNASEDVSHIIYDMSYTQNRRNSIRLAKDIQKSMQEAGRMSRGVQEAGFWVLWSTAMPSVLVELDFICNPEQAKFLGSTAGQDKLAGAIFQAVKKYESYYRQNLGKSEPSTVTMLELAQNNINGVSSKSQEPEPEPAQTVEPVEETVAVVAVTEPAEEPKRENVTATTTTSGNRTSRRHHKASPSPAPAPAAAVPESRPDVAVNTAEDSNVTPTAHRTRRRHNSKTSQETAAAPREVRQETAVAEEPTVQTVEEPAQQTEPQKPSRGRKGASQRKAQKQSMKTVYKVLLFSSDRELKATDKSFKNLKGVTFYIENDLYNYTYGESGDRDRMEEILEDLLDDFPEARIIERIS